MIHTNEQVPSKEQLIIIEAFNIVGDPVSMQPFGSGHINDTFKLTTDIKTGPQYLIQRINTHVFKNVDQLMHNVDVVCRHIRNKLESMGEPSPEKKVLTPIRTRSQDLYYKDKDNQYWRMYVLLDHTKSYDVVSTPRQALEGGKAFGRFLDLLSDLSPKEVYEVIPNFLHIGSRLNDFKTALGHNPVDREREVVEEIQFISAREAKMNTLLDMAAKGMIPLRITHNDTKFNNVLLNEQDEAQCVVDIDTVMPGLVAYDFGDAIRSIISGTAEDERDLSKIQLNLPLFDAYTQGYLKETHFLTAMEIESLVDGVLLLPYMQMVRFLTDYLNGDTYYKIDLPDDNLVRTRTQMKLVMELEKREVELREMVRRQAKLYKMME